MGKPRLLALLVAALVRTATAGVISCPSSGGSLRSTEADGRVSIDGTDFGSSDYATCTFVIGNGTAGRLQLSDLRVDFDSGVGLWLYDGDTPSWAQLLFHLSGFTNQTFLSSEGPGSSWWWDRPLRSRSGFFTLIFATDFDSYRGAGLSASWSHTSAAKAPPQPPPPAPTPGPSSATASVASARALAAALSDPRVSTVLVTQHLSLSELAPPPARGFEVSRSVTVQGRCPGPPPPGAPASLLPPGACVVDAGLRSRHFFVRPGGFLQLSSLALVGGTDLQGGSVLAVGGRFSARGCLFANNTGLGDGGSVLGVAGAAVSLESCAFLGSDSVGGLGGAAAAVGGSSLEAIECSFEQCSSQNGGAVGIQHGSTGAVARSNFTDSYAAGYGGCASAERNASLTVTGSRLSGCSSDFFGGMLYCYYNSTCALADMAVDGALSGTGGGALYAELANLTISRSVFRDCVCTGLGAVIQAYFGQTDIVYTDMLNSVSGLGGALSVYGAVYTQAPAWCTLDWCRFTTVGIVGGTFANGSTTSSTGSGAFLNVIGSGTRVSVSGAAVANNACRGSGGAVFFKSGMGSLQLLNSTFSGNSAARCGAVDVRNARFVQIVGTTFDGNEATAGEGGGLCVAPLAPGASLATCVSGQVLRQFEPAGYLAAMPVTQQAPNVDADCSWELVPPPDCLTALSFQLLSSLPVLTASLAVFDRGSGEQLYADDFATGELPAGPIVSTTNGGLRVEYRSANSINQVPFIGGMAAAWHSACPLLSEALAATVSPFAAAMFAPLAERSGIGGFTLVALKGVRATRNVARGGSGGFMFVDMRSALLPGSADNRLALVAVEDSDASGNAALAGDGGAVSAASAWLALRGVNASANVATGNGGGAAVRGSPGVVIVDSARFEDNTAGESGGGIFSDDSTMRVTSSAFARNVALYGDGGALCVQGTNTAAATGLALRNTEVSACSAGVGGGAIGAEGFLSLDIQDSSLVGNDAKLTGGCLYLYSDPSAGHSSSVSISRTTLGNCTVRSSAVRAGLRAGGLSTDYLRSGVAFAVHTAAPSSAPAGGGAAALTGAVAEVSDCVFASSRCEFDGAALAIRHTPSAAIARTAFADNAATGNGARGGALFLWNVSSASLAGCGLDASSAAGDGGGAFVGAPQPDGAARLLLAGTAIRGAAAGRNGGALATLGNVTVDARGVRLEDGAAAGAGGCVAVGAGGGSVALSDSALARCHGGAPSGSALAAVSVAVGGACGEGEVSGGELSPDGGALWLGRNASAALSRTGVAGCSATGSGGAAFVSQGARLALSASDVRSCSAARAGGAFALSGGASTLRFEQSNATANSAGSGGFVAFMDAAAAAAAAAGGVVLRAANVSACAAAAGSLFALVDGKLAFQEPACEGPCDLTPQPAASYGPRVATPPTAVAVEGPQAPIRPGSEFSVVARLSDAFSQRVAEYNKILVTLECVTEYAPSADAAGTAAGALEARECYSSAVLLGRIFAVFADSKAELTQLSLKGGPGTTFGMAVTAGADTPQAITALFNVSIAPCGRLERYNPATGQCGCRPGFTQGGAAGECLCPGGAALQTPADPALDPTCVVARARRFGRLSDGAFTGIMIGGGVLVICVIAAFASEYSRRVERRLWQSELASEKELLRALQSRLSAAEGEADVADSALDVLRQLYPLANGLSVAIFAEGGKAEVALCKTWAQGGTAAKALQSALLSGGAGGKLAPPPRGGSGESRRGPSLDGSASGGRPRGASLPAVAEAPAGAAGLVDFSQTSMRWVNERQLVADSRDFADGVRAFPDWAAAASRGGLRSQRAITAPITAGPVTLGVAVLHFPNSRPGRSERSMLEFCKAVGGALFVRRTLVGIVYDSAGAALSDGASRDPSTSSTLRGGAGGSQASSSRRYATLGGAGSGGRGGAQGGGGSFLAAEAATPDDQAAWEQLDAEAPAARARLAAWSLDAWALDGDELCRLAVHMFHSLGLVRAFRLRVSVLQEFVQQVAAHYWEQPFHNLRHAWTVAHTSWRLVTMSADLRGRLHDLDTLALLLSSLCHDLEHPGTTNAFHINTGSELAMLYNDVHVLENHHAHVAFQLLEETGLLAHVPQADRKLLRKLVVDAILSTDMAQHKDLVARVQKHASGELPPLRAELVDDRLVLVSLLLHCADLHTPTLEPHVSKRVADSLSDEFEAQAAVEREAGLKVTVMLPSATQSKAALEIGFITYVVKPLFQSLVAIAPDLGVFVERIDASLAMWNAHQLATAPPPGAGGEGAAAGAGPRASVFALKREQREQQHEQQQQGASGPHGRATRGSIVNSIVGRASSSAISMRLSSNNSHGRGSIPKVIEEL